MFVNKTFPSKTFISKSKSNSTNILPYSLSIHREAI